MHEPHPRDGEDEDEGGRAEVAEWSRALVALAATPVAEIMVRNVFCATPQMDLDALTYVLLDQGISGAPVVDEHGRPIGVVSKTDVLRALRDASRRSARALLTPERAGHGGVDGSPHARDGEALATQRVYDVMTPMVFWLPEDAPISRAAALMAYEGVHRIPVVNHQGKVTGVVSTLDVLGYVARLQGYEIPR
ncbi:CBS domain-containing protein [Myxococcota bacterium]|nr:CBS domain-containing protein [Myxococcota bacterium]